MKKNKYHVTIMSIDPDLSDEDNHQKYGYTIEAENETKAKEEGVRKLQSELGYDAPIFWTKCFQIL